MIHVRPELTPAQVSLRCRLLLIDFRNKYLSQHPRRSGAPPFPICGHDVIHAALDHGIATCEAVEHLLNIDLGLAAAIVRSFLELSTRIMWCKTRDNGWQEILGWWAEDTLKAADRHTKDLNSDPLTPLARQSLNSLAKSAPKKKPSLDYMLKQLSDGQYTPIVKKHINETYASLFKGSLHQAAHANLVFLGLNWSGKDEMAIGRSLVRASCWLINSCDKYLGWDENRTIKYFESFLNVIEAE